MIINKTEIPWNMEYIFTDADVWLNQTHMEKLDASYTRAQKLKEHNGALVMGLVSAAAYWLRYAYKNHLPVNQTAYEKCIHDLDAVRIQQKLF